MTSNSINGRRNDTPDRVKIDWGVAISLLGSFITAIAFCWIVVEMAAGLL